MTAEKFLTQFPEFKGVELDLVQAHLDAAALEIDVDIWGLKADQGQAYLAAHKMALSPYGQNARLSTDDGRTTYFTHYKALRLQVTSGFRVT